MAPALRLALPGEERLLAPTRSFLARAGVKAHGYDSKARRYRLKVEGPLPASGTMLRDRDIPVLVGVGSYDLGVCSQLWAEELLARYPSSGLVRLFDLGAAPSALYVACARDGGARFDRLDTLSLPRQAALRVVTEQPNLTERFVLEQRVPRPAIFPVWDRAEAYLPEHADLAVLAADDEAGLTALGLRPVATILRSTACVVANSSALEGKEMGPLLERLAAAAWAERAAGVRV